MLCGLMLFMVDGDGDGFGLFDLGYLNIILVYLMLLYICGDEGIMWDRGYFI